MKENTCCTQHCCLDFVQPLSSWPALETDLHLPVILYSLYAFRGLRVTWIGAVFELDLTREVISCKMACELHNRLKDCITVGMVGLRELRAPTGRLLWMAGILPRTRCMPWWPQQRGTRPLVWRRPGHPRGMTLGPSQIWAQCCAWFPLYTLHFTLHTLHSTLHTLHFTLHALHFTLHTLHFTLYPLHSTPYTVDFTLYTTFYTLHSPLYTLHFTLRTLHFTLRTLHFTINTPHSTLYSLHSALYTLHFTLYTSTPKSTLHTLHPTLYTLHAAIPTSHSTHHILHSTLQFLHALPPVYGALVRQQGKNYNDCSNNLFHKRVLRDCTRVRGLHLVFLFC